MKRQFVNVLKSNHY